MANKHYDTTPLNSNVDEQVELESCVKYIKTCWEKWDSHWASKFSEFEKFYDRWVGVSPRRDEEWQANFTKRLTWQAEKTLVSRYHSALFPVSAPIDTDASEVRDELQAIIAKSTVSHWFKIGLISKEFLKGMRSSAIYGTGMFEDDWYVRTERQPEYVDKDVPDYRPMVDENKKPLLDDDGNVRSHQVGNKKIQQEEWKRKVVEDRYRVRKSNIFAWRIHPDKLDDDDDYPVIKQEFINYDTLVERDIEDKKHGLPGFDNLKKIQEDKTKINEEDKAKLMKDGTFYDEDNPNLEVLYYWGLYKDEADGKDAVKKPMWIAVVNRKYTLFKRENPRWDKKSPLFHIVWTEDEKDSYYGIGLAQIGGSAEDRANNNVNIRTDIKKKTSRASGWYNGSDKKIKKKQLAENTPGLWRQCTDPTKAAFPDPIITLQPEDYKEEEVAVNDHREITGATASLLPPADKKQQPDTLGGMKLNLAQSLARLRPDLTMMEMMGIRKIANRAFLMTRQNLKEPLWIELLASEDQKKQYQLQKIFQLNPRQIIGKVNFHCTGLSESVEKSQNIDKLLKFTEISAKIPPLQMVTNYEGIGKQLMLWLGLDDAAKFIRSDMNTLDPTPRPQQGMPGQQQGRPGQGQPQGMPQPGGNGGLPPEVIAQIASGIQRRR